MSISLGTEAPAFTLPGVDGRTYTLEDFDEYPVFVFIQSCNHCPYVMAWEDRMVAIQRDYADRGVRLVAVSSNDAAKYLDDSFEAMKRRALEKSFTFPYLYDESQDVARALGSERTPEVFVFDRDRRLAYHGAIDDNREEDSVSRHYLRDALDAVLEGREPETAETPPVGCTVKWRS